MLNTIYRFLISLGYISPIHPPLTHIPIGLVTGALIFGIVAVVAKSPRIALIARGCAILALIFAFIVVFAGFMDWQHYYSGGWLHPITMKLIVAGVLIGLLFVAVVLGQRATHQTMSLLGVYVLCFLAVTTLGWYGDKLTYSARVDAVPPQARQGALLFVNNCWSCHPEGGNLIAPALQLRSSTKLQDLTIFVGWIRHPNPPMPPFPLERVSDQQARILYQYVNEYIRTQSDGG